MPPASRKKALHEISHVLETTKKVVSRGPTRKKTLTNEFKKNYIQTLTTAAQVHKSRKNKKQLKQTSKHSVDYSPDQNENTEDSAIVQDALFKNVKIKKNIHKELQHTSINKENGKEKRQKNPLTKTKVCIISNDSNNLNKSSKVSKHNMKYKIKKEKKINELKLYEEHENEDILDSSNIPDDLVVTECLSSSSEQIILEKNPTFKKIKNKNESRPSNESMKIVPLTKKKKIHNDSNNPKKLKLMPKVTKEYNI